MGKQCSNKKVVLLTGCSGPLGRNFIQHFADTYQIIGVGRQNAPTLSKQISYYVGNITTDYNRLIEKIVNDFGAIDVLVNNAVHYNFQPLTETTLDNLLEHFTPNVFTPVLLARACLEYCWRYQTKHENERLHRTIVNVSSVSAYNFYPQTQQAEYAASKAALDRLTQYMAHDYAQYGVKATTLSPSAFPRRVSTDAVSLALSTCIDYGRNYKKYIVEDEQPYWY